MYVPVYHNLNILLHANEKLSGEQYIHVFAAVMNFITKSKCFKLA